MSVAGGTESQLVLEGEQRNPNIADNVIVFEGLNMNDPSPNLDIYLYDLATNTLYQLTNTPILNEYINDISVVGTQVRVVWQVEEAGDYNVYGYKFNLPSRVHNLDTGENFLTIQAAINDPDTVNGNTITVDSGTFYENVNVNKQLILRGIDNGGGKPVVNATGTGSAITLSAGNSTLDGFMAINSSGWRNAGIFVISNDNILVNNTASNNYYGILLWNSRYNTLSNNNASNNIYEYFDTYAGGWVGGQGIVLDYSSNNTLIDNKADSNDFSGIILQSSSNNNTLLRNSAFNDQVGIDLIGNSNGNNLSSNNVSNNYNGIYLTSSSGNILTGNTASNNIYDPGWGGGSGIYLVSSSNNKIYHNNLINNPTQAFDNSVNNDWDNDYPSGGNYWSDYTGVDNNRGPGQDNPGNDGIGDTPYPISGIGDRMDRYPLIELYTGQPPTPVDNTPPTITITGPITVNLSTSASATVSVTDSGSGVASQSHPNGDNTLDTSSVGTKWLNVSARDYASNEAFSNFSYRVVYDFLGAGGFQSPIKNSPYLNTGKAGSSVPVKWQLPDGHGGFITDLSAILSITYLSNTCDSSPYTNEVQADTSGNSGLHYDTASNQFIYNWRMPGTAGCYRLSLRLNDGSVFTADFKLR